MLRLMSAVLGSLRAELRAAGVFDHCEGRTWLKLGAMLFATAACLAATARFGVLAAVVLVPVASVLCTSIAMIGHEGSHRSFSASPLRSALLVYLTFPLFSGLSALYWHHKHDRLHHGHPNVEGMDPDIRPFPFTSSAGDYQACGPKERWFQRHFQKWLFWPMSTLMALGMRRSSLLYLLRYPNKRERAWWLEAACMIVHYSAWLVVPSLVWGPLAAFGVYAAVWGLVGMFLALVFAPAHMGLPVLAAQHHDWLHQIETTRDLELPRVISFFFIGLDYQVEHHLFPKIPHQHLPRAAEITAAWCARAKLRYHRVPYLTALASSAEFMADAWQRAASDPIDVRAFSVIT